MTQESGPEPKFWQIALADLERQLGADRNGLSSAEVAERQLRYGANTLGERRRLSLSLKFLSRFRNPLVLILLAAAAISALTGDLASFIIISTIVLTSAVLDTVQEHRAEEAAEHLKVSVALMEQVMRDGHEVTVLGQDLVPGDVVLLSAGDLVPADGRLLEARDFFVNEALLTGDSFPTEKQARDEGERRRWLRWRLPGCRLPTRRLLKSPRLRKFRCATTASRISTDAGTSPEEPSSEGSTYGWS